MWNRKLAGVSCPTAPQAVGADTGGELSSAWKSLSQTKAALRHIENRLEAAPGTTVTLDSLMDLKKAPSSRSRKVSRRDGRMADPALSKPGAHSRRSPEKSSRSPLRATTLDSNVRRPNCVEFREPLASYREPTPPLLTPSQLEAQTLLSELPSLCSHDAQLSRLVYLRDTRDEQTRHSESILSSALDSTVVRYLNDRSALDALRQPRWEGPPEAPQSSSPGSASRRLEGLRRRQPDDKLEKLKERIRRQREHLEEAVAVEARMGHLERPLLVANGLESTLAVPTAKVRKVAAAPPAPVYKGFNPSEMRIRTPDGKVWQEEELRKAGGEIQREVLLQPSESREIKPKPTSTEKDRPSAKPVRKTHKADSNPAASVINTSSWREGQKLVKMILGPAPRAPRRCDPETTNFGESRGPPPRAKSDPRPESSRRQRASSTEQNLGRPKVDPASSGLEERVQRVAAGDVLPADIRGLLDDLQLESTEQVPATASTRGAKARARSAPGAPGRRAHSNSPTRAEAAAPKRRHYDAEVVRRYIARQQEERRKRQQEEKRAAREEAECRSRRLHELYQRQRGGTSRAPEAPVHRRLRETYTELLREHAGPESSGSQPKPPYQPSGESDKENKRLDRPQSASSSSDLSLSEPQAPPLSREDLGVGVAWMQQDGMRATLKGGGSLSPPSGPTGHLLSQLLGLEAGMSGQKRHNQHPTLTDELTKSKQSRIEALKATAASLSTRIETEARKLALAGAAYGSGKDADVGPPAQTDERWAKPGSPPVRDGGEPLLGAGLDVPDGALPGVGNLHDFMNVGKKVGESSRPPAGAHWQAPAAGQPASPRASSDCSISEGPLLSEGSLSEGSPGAAEPIAFRDFCAAEVDAIDTLGHLRRETQKQQSCRAPSMATEVRGPWEELACGSPHSVINIFTKQLWGHSKAFEEKVERTSSPSLPTASAGYEDDFVSGPCSGGSSRSGKRANSGLSSISGIHSPRDEPLSRRSPFDIRTPGSQSHRSLGSTPLSSPCSAASVHKRESALEQTLVEKQRQSSDLSENQSQDSSRGSPGRGSAPGVGHSVDSDGTLHSFSGLSPLSSASDSTGSPRSPAPCSSTSPQKTTPDAIASAQIDCRKASSPQPSAAGWPSAPSPHSGRSTRPGAGGSVEPGVTAAPPSEPQYPPAALQQRMSAELNYLEAMEESVRQLASAERLRAVGLAQQEGVSLAHILKTQQQRHEHELLRLKLKAEQEELESRRQLEETRQRAARAHTELQENMARSQQVSLEGLQDSARRMVGQQADAARYTAEAARHIREMTELARSQIAQALNVPPTPSASLPGQQREQRQQHPTATKLPPPRPASDRRCESSPERRRVEDSVLSLNSPLESLASGTPGLSRGSSTQVSPSLSSCDKLAIVNSVREEKNSSSVEEEGHTAADDSLCSNSAPSLLDEKADNTSVATEYSLKFDESMTEDDIEEHSFRSLLPSESHRRVTMEQKRGSHEESEEEANREKSKELGTSKDGVKPFSSGQNSFSRFTMDMVRQYMTEEEVRAQHQSSLLRLREKALKDKTRAELAWLEHQKRRLRDKGEDDMMPPLRKRQRGLLLKLQQEQAEIKRLQEANRAARRERQLLLKQQEEIERMRHSTMRLRERLKSAGEANEDATVSETADEAAVPSLSVTDLDTRSPSPVSVSGSETSSIMQKLKKMRCHMDEKHCSPVHYFFSVFTAHHWASLSVCFPNLHPKFQQFIYSQLVRFLTKREQQLMRRRRHAEELLQWKQRLDAEEAEVRSMEQRALAAWGGERPHREGPSGAPASSFDGRTPKGQDGDQSPAVTVSSQPTEPSVPEELGSPSAGHPDSEQSSPHKDLSQEETSIYSEDFDSESKLSPPSKTGTSRHTENGSRGKSHHHSGSWTDRPGSSESRSAQQSEPTSDQSDIESRVRALKEELRKRKSIVYQLKKEQKKRHKERLKAQEASLLKQLECYNDFIQKTKADLSKDLEATPTAKPQIKAPTSATEKPRIKPPHMQRPETRKNWNIVKESEKEKKDDFTQSDHNKFTPIPKESTLDEGPPALTPTPVLGSPEHLDSLKDHVSSEFLSTSVQAARLLPMDSGEESVVSVVSSQRSEVEEELEQLNSDESAGRSFHSLKLDKEISHTDQQQDSLKEDHSVKCSEHEKGLHISEEMKGRETIEDEDLMSSSWQTNRSAAEEPKDQQLPEKETSNKEDLYTPHHLSPVEEDLSTTAEVCVDSYHDDFESSVESAPQEGYMGSADPEKCFYSKSPTFSSEEEISEELLAKLTSASETSHSEKLLGLQAEVEDSKEIVPVVKDGPRSPELFPPSSPPPSETVDTMPDFNIGDRVLVSNVQPGTLRFKGPTSFAKGFWAGVELDKSEGSNNGTYDGVVYFECEDGHGIFAPPDKVSLLSAKLKDFVGTTEDEDSSFDDQFDDESKKKHTETKDLSKLRTSQVTRQSRGSGQSGEGAPPDSSEALVECLKKQDVSDKDLILQSGKFELSDLKLNTNNKINGTQHLTPNGTSRNIILELEDATTGDFDLLITEVGKQEIEKASTPLLDLLTKEKETLEAQQNEKFDAEKRFDTQNVSSLTDKLLNNFVSDAIRQFQKIRNDKNEKILASNQLKGNDEGRSDLKELSPNHVTTCNAQLENLPSFIEDGQEELSSPELCFRPESPVLGISGKEELAKRLAVLELNRELLDDFGEEQDWFDEDFGLSSRKEQQKWQRQEPTPPGLEGTEQAKVPAKSEPPQQAKLQEEPIMVVSHSAPEVEQLVSAATQVIWNSCDLGHGQQSLVGIAPPHAPEDYLGYSNQEQDMVHLSKRSYRQTVFDLTWEIIQEIFSENIDVHPPQWAKPRRLNSLYFRRVKCPADMAEVQAFVTAEVLKLLGLMKDQNQKTDWQKMLKFGRKKRDRVDHILVQELHEEESQWVNYDKDELFVKMQLADGIFDTLLKDTVDIFIQIQEKQAKTSLS